MNRRRHRYGIICLCIGVVVIIVTMVSETPGWDHWLISIAVVFIWAGLTLIIGNKCILGDL